MLSASIGQTNSRASIQIWTLQVFADLELRNATLLRKLLGRHVWAGRNWVGPAMETDGHHRRESRCRAPVLDAHWSTARSSDSGLMRCDKGFRRIEASLQGREWSEENAHLTYQDGR